jgi:hypothetical protein
MPMFRGFVIQKDPYRNVADWVDRGFVRGTGQSWQHRIVWGQ